MRELILIHGFGSSSRAWAPQREALSQRFRVTAVDLPGHGARAADGFDLDAAVSAVREHVTDGAHVLGISGGATVAMLVALAEPGRLGSLLLSAPVAAPPASLAVQRTVMRLTPEPLLRNMMAKLYSGNRQRYRETAKRDFARCGKANLLAALAAIAELDLRERLSDIDAPTLVVCGTRDRENLAPSTVVANGIPSATLHEIPGVGHLWNLEEPELFNRTVVDFAAGH